MTPRERRKRPYDQPQRVTCVWYRERIFTGKVDRIWHADDMGQYLPSDEVPKFQQPNPQLKGQRTIG